MKIEVKGLSKQYGVETAVDNISFAVDKGEILGFLGPNGAGKTTTMKIITCFLAPNSGEVTVGGNSIRTDPDEVKKNIGYLPENNPLYLDMPLIDYLAFAARLQGVSKGRVRDRIAEMLDICGLTDEKHKKIGELSKGYRQRVGLAQAMIHDPEVLILDEPTSGLDPNQIVEIRKLIKNLGKEKTVILSTHILPEVEATCDRIMIINKGSIVADGTAQSLRKQASGGQMIKLRLEKADRNEAAKLLLALEGVTSVDPISEKEAYFEVHSQTADASKAIFQLCVQNSWILTELTPTETRLEDIFRDLTIEQV